MKKKLFKLLSSASLIAAVFCSKNTHAQTGAALNVDGLGDFVNLGSSMNATFQGTNKLTVEAWVKPTTNTGLGVIVGNYGTPGAGMQYLLRRDNGNFNFFVSNGVFVNVLSVATITLNTWTHVAGTWDGAVLRIYVNGVASGTAAATGNFPSETNPVWIGGNLAGAGEYFTGDIDEVRIWNRTLCLGEINNNRTAQIILPQTNLLAYYQFNQGVASAANPSVNTLIPLTGPTGTLAPAITLNGATSNWVAPSGVVTGSNAPTFVPAVLSVSGPTVTCSGNTVVLTATSSSSGLNYSWNTGATTNSISINPVLTTTYTAFGSNSLTCGQQSFTLTVNQTAPNVASISSSTICNNSSATLSGVITSSFCQPAFSSGTGGGDYIGGVTLGTITNTTLGAPLPYYTLYPQTGNTTTTLTAGNAYTITLQAGTYASGQNIGVWINYNQNASLDDLGEKIGEVVPSGAYPTAASIVFTVPTSAFNGVTRLRVKDVFGGVGLNSCTGLMFGETEDYNITIVGGITPTFSWSPSNFLSSTNTQTTTASNPSVSTVYTLVATNAGCSNTSTVALNVVNAPTVNVTGNTVICGTGTNVIIASGANTYSWNIGATTASISVSPTITTNYTVVGTATNGCAQTTTLTQNVGTTPTIAVNNGTICSGNSFTILPSGANTYTIQGGSNVVNPTSNTSYTVRGTSAAGCISANTATSIVTVNANPLVLAASSNTNFICVGSTATLTATGANTYVWNTTATTAVIAVSPTTTTSYTVTGTTAAGCSANAVLTQSVNTCTGINSNLTNLTSNFIVYPNPSNGIFNVQLESAATIEVTDVLGRVILTDNVNAGTYQLNLGNNVNGVYFVKATVDGKTKTVKIVKD